MCPSGDNSMYNYGLPSRTTAWRSLSDLCGPIYVFISVFVRIYELASVENGSRHDNVMTTGQHRNGTLMDSDRDFDRPSLQWLLTTDFPLYWVRCLLLSTTCVDRYHSCLRVPVPSLVFVSLSVIQCCSRLYNCFRVTVCVHCQSLRRRELVMPRLLAVDTATDIAGII